MSAEPKVYWRSLEQRRNAGRSDSSEREFPEDATELPPGISRRDMLGLMGASLSLAGLTACRRPLEKIVPYVSAPEEIVPGLPLHFATTMPFGLSALGIVVESNEGRPTKIEGNELHPSTAGSSSAWMQASILDLYDPDRLPGVRLGEEQKTWADFLAAWRALEPSYAANGGEGLAVLSEPFASPSLARVAQMFRQRFPRARWVVYEPISDENLHAGLFHVAQKPLRPLHHLDRADVVLSLDSDFLLTESESIAQSRAFADRRRVASAQDSMSRLYVVESTLSLTGGNADHRLRLASAQIGSFTAALAAELVRQGLVLQGAAQSPFPEIDARWLSVLAQDLLQARGRCLILAGRRQPAAVHAAVFMLNEALGNRGRTVSYHELVDAAPSRVAGLTELAAALGAGSIVTLVMLGGNPCYDAPADLGLAQALGQVQQVIHLTSQPNETTRLAHWRLPRAHFLESWGDARAADGTLSVVQPLIEPLFGGRSSLELLGLLATGAERPGYDWVRETWLQQLGPADFEQRFRRVLHDGLLQESALPPAELALPATPSLMNAPEGAPDAAAAATRESLEIVFQPSPALYDGRFANNGWLQELPDPITKLTWDNPALISPATARAFGLENGDMVRLSYRERALELPIWIAPGQADFSLSLQLGHGRQAAGRVGTARGFNAYVLRTSQAADFDRGLRLEATGVRASLSQTQEHGSMEGRPVVREAALEHYRGHPEFAREMVEHPPLKSPWREHAYDSGPQWGMSIDLNVCTGCSACVIACQSENNIPVVGKEQVGRGREMHWIRVDRYFAGSEEDPQAVFQAVPCMHCENAPCEQVCPVAATVHDHEGLNTMAYNRCIGTRYCSNNCPYKVRRFNFFNYTKDTPELLKMANNPDVTVRTRGVMEKCTYCTQRINEGKIEAKLAGRELRDGDITPACAQACPTRAITFGDIRDPQSRVSRLKQQDRDYAMLAELNTRPRTTYLAKLRNPHPDLSGDAGAG